MARTTLTAVHSLRQASTTPVVKPGTNSANPVFDATKAALKQSLEGSSRVDPFSEAMREAYDNDWTEAANRFALGLAEPSRNGVSDRIGKSTAKSRGASQSRSSELEASEPLGQNAEMGPVTEIGRSTKADAIEQTIVRPTKSPGLTRHELLMRLSVSMSREQTLTFGSEEAAKKVLSRRSHFLWARDPLRTQNLRLAEMRAALSA